MFLQVKTVEKAGKKFSYIISFSERFGRTLSAAAAAGSLKKHSGYGINGEIEVSQVDILEPCGPAIINSKA